MQVYNTLLGRSRVLILINYVVLDLVVLVLWHICVTVDTRSFSRYYFFLPFSGHCTESTQRRASNMRQTQHQKPGRCLRCYTLLWLWSVAQVTDIHPWKLDWVSQLYLWHRAAWHSSQSISCSPKSLHLNFAMVTDIISRIPDKIPGLGLIHKCVLFFLFFFYCLCVLFKSFLLSPFFEWNVELLIWP